MFFAFFALLILLVIFVYLVAFSLFIFILRIFFPFFENNSFIFLYGGIGVGKGLQFLFCFTLGGIIYPLIEILWRGYTHFSMAVVGGVCFAFIYFIHTRYAHLSALIRSFFCCVGISIAEFFSGIFLNLILRLDVWDYSSELFNLYGQICLSYCIVWFLLSLACAPLCSFLKKIFIKIRV